jgi:RNA recognition motif-containing protein
MSTNIYVGNLPFSATEDEVHKLFSAYGTVERVNLITDRETGRLKGFGFGVFCPTPRVGGIRVQSIRDSSGDI